MRRLRLFLQLPFNQKLLYLETLFLLGLSRLAILCFTFRKIAPHLGKEQQVTPEVASDVDPQVNLISEIIQKASRNVPWKSLCLVQAMTARLMLGRRGFDSTIYIGVRKDEENQLLSHAWLRHGKFIVTGASEEPFSVMMTFANQPQNRKY